MPNGLSDLSSLKYFVRKRTDRKAAPPAAERLGHHLVDTRIGFAKADLCRLDDMVEQRHHLSDVKRSAAEAADTVGWEVVGDTAGLEFQFYALESLHHLGSQVS